MPRSPISAVPFSAARLAGATIVVVGLALPLLAQQAGGNLTPQADATKAGATKVEAQESVAQEAPVLAQEKSTSPPSPEIEDLAQKHGGLTLTYRFVMDGNAAQGKLQRTADGDVRLDLNLKDPTTKLPIKTSIIVLAGDQDTAFNLIHTTRQMGRVSLPDVVHDGDGRYLFEDLGKEELLNQATRHIKLTDTKSGDEFELWLAPAAGKLKLLSRMIRSLQKYHGSLAAAVIARGVDGMPLKLKYTKRRTGTVTTGECTQIDPGPVPAKRFQPPRGYRNSKMESLNPLEGKGGALGGLKKMFKGFGRRR